ncbi:MAG: class I SAM-dependent methyltransferase [Candidatus Micrarchaeota archaeon]
MAKVTNCRICYSPDLYTFLKLGPTPLANSFLKFDSGNVEEEEYPLDVCLCRNCGLVQIDFVVPPEVMFKDYIYLSSTSDTIRAHFAGLAKEVLDEFSKPDDLIVEIASNDGVLLKNMLGKGVRPLGVEPATNVAKIAEEAGVETVNEFFNSKMAEKIAAERGKAAAILANNVFGHVMDLNDFARGIGTLLADDGVVIIEVPYLVELYKRLEFDTIYHEHLSYFTIKPVMFLFEKYGMEVFNVKRFPVHGGTIRIYAQKKGGKHPINKGVLDGMIAEETSMGLYEPRAYDEFAKKVENLQKNIIALLKKLKDEGNTIACYGAPAKGNTLLNSCKIGTDLIDFAVDKSPFKQNLLTPGMHIPVYPVEKLKEQKVDYLLILAWNFADEIMRQQAEFRESGGKFIIPVPEPKIV